MDNLVTLCAYCHEWVPAPHEWVEDYAGVLQLFLETEKPPALDLAAFGMEYVAEMSKQERGDLPMDGLLADVDSKAEIVALVTDVQLERAELPRDKSTQWLMMATLAEYEDISSYVSREVRVDDLPLGGEPAPAND